MKSKKELISKETIKAVIEAYENVGAIIAQDNEDITDYSISEQVDLIYQSLEHPDEWMLEVEDDCCDNPYCLKHNCTENH